MWSAADENYESLGGRVVGGSSAVNACMVVAGAPADYDEWGESWSHARLRPYLDRARARLRVAPANAATAGPLHEAFLDAAQELGFPLLSSPDDPAQPTGVAPFPANVVDGTRWNAAFAYLDECRSRPNLTLVADTLVDRIAFEGTRATGVVDASGNVVRGDLVVLAAGAYFSPAILLRSGVGPGDDLAGLGIPVLSEVATGRQLLDHCGTTVSWRASDRVAEDARARRQRGDLVEPHAVLKAASSMCPEGLWDLHLLSWISATEEGGFEAAAIVFHMKPSPSGSLSLPSRDPNVAPRVVRGFLTAEEDLAVIVDGLALARRLAATEPLRPLLAEEVRPAARPPEEYVRATVRNYFHPAGTCAIGAVVDERCRVLGVEGVVVADASVMPTIPRANTNLTTAAIAERVSELL
jgi:choline dehydrogenase